MRNIIGKVAPTAAAVAVATVLSAGGGAYAAVHLVTGGQIQNGTITSADVRDSSLRKADLTSGLKYEVDKANTAVQPGALGQYAKKSDLPQAGAPGAPGADGKDGIDGKDGADGKDGKDGVSGYEVTGATLAHNTESGADDSSTKGVNADGSIDWTVSCGAGKTAVAGGMAAPGVGDTTALPISLFSGPVLEHQDQWHFYGAGDAGEAYNVYVVCVDAN